MSIVEKNKIDIVAVNHDSSIVRLVITDHLLWDEFDTHAQMLQDKVNTYLDFIESGQIFRLQDPRVPEAAKIHIVLALQHPPTNAASELFLRISEFLSGLGLTFVVETRPIAT
ncbi:MAG TPA: hypothetical protein PK156_51230 [Polyangium sp.]|nr:hypothetical protein [Polyangium sp.]